MLDTVHHKALAGSDTRAAVPCAVLVGHVDPYHLGASTAVHALALGRSARRAVPFPSFRRRAPPLLPLSTGEEALSVCRAVLWVKVSMPPSIPGICLRGGAARSCARRSQA